MNRLPTPYPPADQAADFFDRFTAMAGRLMGLPADSPALAAWGNGENPFFRFQREMQQAFDHAAKTWGIESWPELPSFAPLPRIDQSEDDKVITFKLNAPGMAAKDIDVEVAEGRLTIRGSREEKPENKGEGEKPEATHKELAESFSSTTALPSYAESDKAEAKYANGVLTVTVPKQPGKGAKKVAVQPA